MPCCKGMKRSKNEQNPEQKKSAVINACVHVRVHKQIYETEGECFI